MEIVAAVDGQLARLDVGLGDPVHPNQAIGMITPDLRSSEDGTSARNHVLVAELEHQAAAIAWNESRERLERLNALPDLVPGADRAAAQFDERAAATRVGIADALLGQRRAELRAQERIDSSAVLRSPIMGSVAAILSVQGATVTRGMPLVRIIGGRVLTLRFAAPAHRRNDLFIGAALSVKGQGFTETATLIRLSAEVDPLTQLIVGDASLDSPAPSSLAGTRAEVRVLNPLAAAR